MPFSSSRRRSRGIVSKKSSGIWKVENEGIDSMRERYRIEDHRLNGRTRRDRVIVNESSDESFDEEMAEERTMNKAKLKIYDEVIGVPVPRRARSGLKRRPQDSVIAAQPSNASKGSREEMVPISESEVEVAKFLFGLTRLNSQDSDATADTFQSSSVPDTSTSSKDSKRKKSRHIQTNETGKSSMTITTCNSSSDGTTNQVNSDSSVPISSTSGQQADSSSCIKEMAASSPKLHKISSPNNIGQTKIDAQFLGPQNSVPIPFLAEEKPSPTSFINAKTLTSPDHHERPNSNATCKTQHEQTEQLSEMESQMKRDLLPLSSQNEKFDPHKSASSVSSVKDCGKRVKHEFDHMALPDDGEGEATDEFNPLVSDFNQGTHIDEITRKRGILGLPDKLEIGDSKPKQNSACLHESHTKRVRREGMDKQPQIEAKTGSCQDDNNSDKIGTKLHSEKIVKDGELLSGRADFSGLSNNIATVIPTPNPISVPCWPGSIRPFGFPGTGSAGLSVAPALQGTTPVEGKTLMPNAPIVMLPPTRPGHCATHCFIARLIQSQQQLVKLNPLWQAAGSLDKPYNLSALPQPGALVLGGPVIRNPNATIGSSAVSLNCQYPVPNHSDSLKNTKKGMHLLFQQEPQGGVFLFPINQMQSQTAGRKASHLPTSSASAPTSNSCSNLASVPDTRYLTTFKGNYPFPNSSAYQSYMAQQQRPPLALIPGSSSSSQYFSQPLQLIPNPTVSTVSFSQKYLQANPFLHSHKIPSEAHLNNKPEHSGTSEVSHSQRTLQNYSFPAGKHCHPLSLLTNQAKTLPKAESSRSEGPSEWNRLRNQAVAQTNSPISTLSTLVSTTSIASSDRNNTQQGLSSLQRMPKPENYLENTSIRKDTTIPSLTTAAKTQQTLFSTLVRGQQNKLQQAHLSLSMGLTTVAAVSYVQGAASLPMKSAEQKPAAG